MTRAEPSPFEGTAEYYARYRPGIPGTTVEYLKNRFRLGGHGRALDLGCGTGQLTFALAPVFENVVGLDPDPEMIAEAKSQCEQLPELCGKISWENRKAESLKTDEGPYRLATMSRAFVWMDQYLVLKLLKDVVVPGGGVAILGDGSFWSGTDDWQKIVKKTVQSFLGETRKAGKSGVFFDTGEPYTDMLRKSGYRDVERVDFAIERDWSFSEVVGCLYSTSFAARSLFGDQLEAFEQKLHENLGAPSDKQRFTERVDFTVQSGFR